MNISNIVQWPFANADAFSQLIMGLTHNTDIGDKRFCARNFRLENHVSDDRFDSYLPFGDLQQSGGGSGLTQLQRHHDAYIDRTLRRGDRLDEFDGSSTRCPETFRADSNGQRLALPDDTYLVRVDSLDAMESKAGTPAETLYSTFDRASSSEPAAKPSKTDKDRADHELLKWQTKLDNRPMFAAPWDDAERLLVDPQPGWANELRDRLGLTHYDPTLANLSHEIRVVVFRYRTALVPRDPTTGARPIFRPTVLDGALSQGFCTADGVQPWGLTVDLAGRAETPWRELVHPAVALRSEHIWAVGKIVEQLAQTPLDKARGVHVLKMSETASPALINLYESLESDII